MAIDPICHMTVDEQTALSARVDGENYYFCCEGCRAKFLQQRGGPQLVSLEPAGAQHECCGHGAHATVSTAKLPPGSYYCPMSEGVVSDKPGTCPK
jgi:Cu+-exporting ATPase